MPPLSSPVCDMILLNKYERMAAQKRANDNALFLSKKKTQRSFVAEKMGETATGSQNKFAISPCMKNFRFFPSPRKHLGPKKRVTLRDHTHAITSAQAIQLLAEEREKKRAEEEKKTSRVNKRLFNKKPVAKKAVVDNNESSEDPEDRKYLPTYQDKTLVLTSI